MRKSLLHHGILRLLCKTPAYDRVTNMQEEESTGQALAIDLPDLLSNLFDYDKSAFLTMRS
jgi:hypothetical protein